MFSPIVSVVLPTHNRVDFLRLAISSVRNQTEKNIEIIVVDDASSDGTTKFLSGLLKIDSRITVLKNSISLGGGGARNAGILASKSKWIAFLDDDDLWMENKLEVQLQALAKEPDAVACSCSYMQIDKNGKKNQINILSQKSFENLL